MSDSGLVGFTAEQVAEAEEQIQLRSKRIEYYITELSVEILAQKTRDHEYVVPVYQREFTWEEARKWRFIESLLMGLPIPFLFFWEDPSTGKLEIVDGSQRLRTLEAFLNNDLVLGDLEKLPALIGFRFRDLPESRQRKIKNRSIRGIVLSEHADAEARFDLFDRINTGSKVANRAEVRRGAFTGPFMDLIVALGRDPLFVRLAPVSEKQVKEREREELVTRFFAYGDGLDCYEEEVSPFLSAYAKKMNEEFTSDPSIVGKYTDRFNRVMAFVAKTFPHGFRRSSTGKATPRSRFEAIAIGSWLALQHNPDLPASFEMGRSIVEDDAFKTIVRSDAANVMSRLEGRLHFVRNRLLGTAP